MTVTTEQTKECKLTSFSSVTYPASFRSNLCGILAVSVQVSGREVSALLVGSRGRALS